MSKGLWNGCRTLLPPPRDKAQLAEAIDPKRTPRPSAGPESTDGRVKTQSASAFARTHQDGSAHHRRRRLTERRTAALQVRRAEVKPARIRNLRWPGDADVAHVQLRATPPDAAAIRHDNGVALFTWHLTTSQTIPWRYGFTRKNAPSGKITIL